MPKVLPFNGVRFDWKRISLSRVLCPPYDVIAPSLARRLRKTPCNAIHLELPEGSVRVRYRRAARAYRAWMRDGYLLRDARPAYYVLRQDFRWENKTYRRTGFLAAVGLDRSDIREIVPHERTFPKPKQDRRRLFRALRTQTSPIFALFPDPGGRVRRVLSATSGQKHDAQGVDPNGVRTRVWRLTRPDRICAVERALSRRTLLIADGHHRLEVAKGLGLKTALFYLCPQEDPGLLLLPTHRVVAEGTALRAELERRCRVIEVKSLDALRKGLEARPGRGIHRGAKNRGDGFMFGAVFREGGRRRAFLAQPLERGLNRRFPTGLGIEWVSNALLDGFGPDRVSYTHDAREAWRSARGRAISIFIKSITVEEVCRAVRKAGLLPQKSTYFYPKVGGGIVFKPAEFSGRSRRGA